MPGPALSDADHYNVRPGNAVILAEIKPGVAAVSPRKHRDNADPRKSRAGRRCGCPKADTWQVLFDALADTPLRPGNSADLLDWTHGIAMVTSQLGPDWNGSSSDRVVCRMVLRASSVERKSSETLERHASGMDHCSPGGYSP